MSENRYALAGWLSITGAVLFVASFVVGIIEAVIAGSLVVYALIGPFSFVRRLVTGRAARAELDIFD